MRGWGVGWILHSDIKDNQVLTEIGMEGKLVKEDVEPDVVAHTCKSWHSGGSGKRITVKLKPAWDA